MMPSITYESLSVNERLMLIQPLNFLTMYHLLENKEIGLQFDNGNGLSIFEVTKTLGYNTAQGGGLEKFLRFLIQKEIMYQSSFRVMRPIFYQINKKLLKQLFQCSYYYIASKNHDWGHVDWDNSVVDRVPLPGILRHHKN
jgi:hypothetical protein